MHASHGQLLPSLLPPSPLQTNPGPSSTQPPSPGRPTMLFPTSLVSPNPTPLLSPSYTSSPVPLPSHTVNSERNFNTSSNKLMSFTSDLITSSLSTNDYKIFPSQDTPVQTLSIIFGVGGTAVVVIVILITVIVLMVVCFVVKKVHVERSTAQACRVRSSGLRYSDANFYFSQNNDHCENSFYSGTVNYS